MDGSGFHYLLKIEPIIHLIKILGFSFKVFIKIPIFYGRGIAQYNA